MIDHDFVNAWGISELTPRPSPRVAIAPPAGSRSTRVSATGA